MDALFVIAGLVLLVGGGDLLVRNAVGLAERFGLSRMFIGTVVLGFGTSLPEFVASFAGAARGADAIAFGNVLGSNVANILMILGLSALIHPLRVSREGLWRDAAFVMLGSAGVLLCILAGALPRGGAAALLGLFALYMWLAVRGSGESGPSGDAGARARLSVTVLLSLVAIAALVAGAELLIRGGTGLARGWGVSEALIGILIVGVGTSLPEATTSIIASLQRENALAFANVVGSNVFNALAILGGTALVFPLDIGRGFSLADGLVLLGASGAMFALALTRGRISRAEGAALVLTYGAYLAWRIAVA